MSFRFGTADVQPTVVTGYDTSSANFEPIDSDHAECQISICGGKRSRCKRSHANEAVEFLRTAVPGEVSAWRGRSRHGLTCAHALDGLSRGGLARADGIRHRGSRSQVRGERRGEGIARAGGVDGYDLVGRVNRAGVVGVSDASGHAERDDNSSRCRARRTALPRVVARERPAGLGQAEREPRPRWRHQDVDQIPR